MGGLSPAVVGWVMIPLGLVFAGLGVLRNRRKRAPEGPRPGRQPDPAREGVAAAVEGLAQRQVPGAAAQPGA